MVHPYILHTQAFKLIEEDFLKAIQECPTYICDVCWKLEWEKNVIKLTVSQHTPEICNTCFTKKSEWICLSCEKYLRKNKMPLQAQASNLQLCPRIEKLDSLCPIELKLISQIIPFMFIVAKVKGAQHGLKGQCVLVPPDLKKIQTVLPRSCDDEYIISLALKRRSSDKSVVNKQHIRPSLVNKALEKLIEINPFYRQVRLDNSWEDISKESDPELWELLTDEKAKSKTVEETDSEEDVGSSNNTTENQSKMSSIPCPTVLHEIDRPSVSQNQIINVALGEGNIPVSFSSEPNREALAFPEEYATGKNHFNEARAVPITPTKCVHTRLKCCNDRFASNIQYIFHALDWIKREAVWNSINFAKRKQF